MQYRQDSKVNSNKTSISPIKGVEIEEIVYDKQITQEWKVDTQEPTQMLPYNLKKIYLQRICDFWHNLKFFYHENYSQLNQNHVRSSSIIEIVQVSQIQSYSSVEIVHSAEVIENCKRISKVIWKLMRHRLLKAFDSIKETAGIEEEESMELEDEKLKSYMIFLRLQENSRLQLGVETFDSVVEKNTRRKLLDGFLNMKENMKNVIRRETYRDKIKLDCFSEIVMRNIKKINIDVFVDSFTYLFEYSQGLKREQQYKQEEEKRKKFIEKEEREKREREKREREIQQREREESYRAREEYRSVSNRKGSTTNQSEASGADKRTTILKNQYKYTPQQSPTEPRQNQNYISTVKRQTPIDKQLLQNSNIYSITSQQLSNIHSHDRIIHSHYYYEDEEIQTNMNQQHHTPQQNLNSLPTKRQHKHNYYSNNTHTNTQHQNNYRISGVQNNINSQTLYQPQKTVRTPSRSDVNKNSVTKNPQPSKPISTFNEDLHIPVTQRIDKHYRHQHHYQQQLLQQQNSHHDDSQQNIHQQICVIRNFSSTPTRKPDRYEKIPILSSNIEFRQFFLNSKSKDKDKKSHKKEVSHTTSFYQKKVCEDCQYCKKMNKIKQMVEHISKQRNTLHTEKIFVENITTVKNQFITQIVESRQDQRNQSQNDIASFNVREGMGGQKIDKAQGISQRFIKQSKKELGSMRLDIDRINENSRSRIEIEEQEKQSGDLKKENTNNSVSRKKREVSPNSPLMAPMGKELHTPSSQVSAFTEGGKRRGGSEERKIFKRKPMNAR